MLSPSSQYKVTPMQHRVRQKHWQEVETRDQSGGYCKELDNEDGSLDWVVTVEVLVRFTRHSGILPREFTDEHGL